jgi:hypothetical protein
LSWRLGSGLLVVVAVVVVVVVDVAIDAHGDVDGYS